MATPILEKKTQSLSLAYKDAADVSFGVIKDASGDPVDISGFDAKIVIRPTSSPDLNASGAQLATDADMTLGVDGTCVWNAAYNDLATVIATTVRSLSLQYQLLMSNDSFTTSQVVRSGTLTVTPQI